MITFDDISKAAVEGTANLQEGFTISATDVAMTHNIDVGAFQQTVDSCVELFYLLISTGTIEVEQALSAAFCSGVDLMLRARAVAEARSTT